MKLIPIRARNSCYLSIADTAILSVERLYPPDYSPLDDTGRVSFFKIRIKTVDGAEHLVDRESFEEAHSLLFPG